ncbi:MAG: nucleoside 2-deoxyribosyltransferase [Nitrosopumilus sp.]|nr:nucleoside 2-deoxyribosyltransferase [Nitrosopumilus sp.]
MVCGSIGYGGIEKIRGLYTVLKEKGFDTINHLLEKDMDYSHINDFRDKRKLSQAIVEHDLDCIDNADVLVVILNSPSYGTAMEMLIAKDKGKRIVLLAKDSVPTPWPIYVSDFIVRDEQELFQLLYKFGLQAQ